MPISPDLLASYFNAGMAVTAYQYGVTVQRLSLRIRDGARDRPRLMQLSAYIETRQAGDRQQAYVDYCRVLLAGSAGRLIGLDSYLAYPRPHLDQWRLTNAHLAEAALCLEPETDRAYAIIVGRLDDLHNGDADVTFTELWRGVHHMLQQQPHQERLAKLVAELRRRRTLRGDELRSLLAT